MANIDGKKWRIALILVLLAAFVAIAGLDLYMEHRAGVTRRVYSEEYHTDKGDSVKYSPTGETVTVRSRESGLRKYKYFKVSDKDTTFLRGMLSAKAWNLICSDENLRRDYELTQLTVDGENKGLFMKSPEVVYSTTEIYGKTPAEVYESAKTAGKADRIVDYFLFLQLTYAYKNISDSYFVTEDFSFMPAIAPERVEYSFGILPGSCEYLRYRGESRVITPAEFGIEGEDEQQALYALMAERWQTLRHDNLTNEMLFEELPLYEQAVIDCGYMETSGIFAGDNDFSAADYYKDSVDRMKKYVLKRIEALDRYYAAGYEFDAADRFVKTAEAEDSAEAEATEDENAAENEAATEYSKSDLSENQGYFEDVSLTIPGTDQEIQLFVLNNKGYFFLPSFVSALQAEKSFEKSASDNDRKLVGSLDGIEYICSANLPATFIGTFNGTMSYINEAKGNDEPGTFVCYGADGSLDSSARLNKVKGKGHSSFSHSDKKSYTICFESGTDVLGIGSSEALVLQANALDKTRIRNTLAYRFAGELGIDYSTKTRYTDLYFNGCYWGTYEYLEPVALGAGCAVNGEYLFEINNDKERIVDGNIFSDIEDTRYELDYPYQADEALLSDMSGWMNGKLALVNECSRGASWEKVQAEIDVESMANMFIMDALFDDVDANFVSTFYRRDAGDRLLAGPVWDYDLTLGNHGKREIDHGINSFADGLPERLMASADFKQLVTDRWNGTVRDLTEQLMGEWADEAIDEIKASLSMDRVRWLYEERTAKDDEEYSGAVDALKDFVNNRIDIIDGIVK